MHGLWYAGLRDLQSCRHATIEREGARDWGGGRQLSERQLRRGGIAFGWVRGLNLLEITYLEEPEAVVYMSIFVCSSDFICMGIIS